MTDNYRVSVSFNEPVFGEETFVYVVKSMKKFCKDNDLEADKSSACYISIKAHDTKKPRRVHVFAFQENHICWEIIAHESFHFALRLMENQIRSIKKNEESFAYPCGMMVEIITDIFRAKKIKILDRAPRRLSKGPPPKGARVRKNHAKKTLTFY